MITREHGTCLAEVQKDLRFGVDVTTADKIACFNKKSLYAEQPGYAFQENKKFELEF